MRDRFATIDVYTGRTCGGCEAVRHFEGMADRGTSLIDTEGEGKPFSPSQRPRAMRFAPAMYSGCPKDWVR
jgi:hypothetical protein